MPVDQFIEGYKILDLVAKHGGGTVYRAVDVATSTQVAIKVLHAEDGDGRLVEAQVSNRLRDEWRAERNDDLAPYPQVYRAFFLKSGASSSGRQLVIVMEWLDGEPLSGLANLAATGFDGLTDPTRVAIMVRLCEALHFGHTRPNLVVHCDVKPGNIFLMNGWQAAPAKRAWLKLIDFGIAYRGDTVGGSNGQGFALTPFYAAPEQFKGNRSPPVDIYSAGLVAFELWSGRRACQDPDPHRWHAEGAVPSVRALGVPAPDGLDALIQAMCSKDPSKRPNGAEAAARFHGLLEATRWEHRRHGNDQHKKHESSQVEVDPNPPVPVPPAPLPTPVPPVPPPVPPVPPPRPNGGLGAVLAGVAGLGALMVVVFVVGVTLFGQGPAENGSTQTPEELGASDVVPEATTPYDGFDSAFYEFVMRPNIEAAPDRREVLKDPSKWDRTFYDRTLASMLSDAQNLGFYRRLESIAEDYALVIDALRVAGLPEVFAAIPYRESVYKRELMSDACALGPWQLMPETAHRLAEANGVGELDVRNCVVRGNVNRWTPSLYLGDLSEAPYFHDGRCRLESCEQDGRTDLGASTRGAVVLLGEAMHDPVLRASGAVVQMAIASHNAGYGGGKFGPERPFNIRPAFMRWAADVPPEEYPKFYGDNIKCDTGDHLGVGLCGAVLPEQTQHYVYPIVGKHLLAVCYFAKNHADHLAYAPWAKYWGDGGFCRELNQTTITTPDTRDLTK